MNDISESLAKFEAKVDELESRFIGRLRRAVMIPSVSAYANCREDVFKMTEYLRKEMESLGIDVMIKPLGKESATDLILPPVVLGQYGQNPDKPFILVYSHYDVQPAAIEDGWTSNPWELSIQDDGRLCGRGTSDDKGPLLGWLNMIEAFQAAGLDLPANLLFWFEGMEENGSTGLRRALEEEADGFLARTDAVCITDTIWAGSSRPSANQDAHSGMFGGHISEPMTDMVNTMSSLVDSEGKLLIPGIYDEVQTVSEEEYRNYLNMNLSEADLDGKIAARSLHKEKVDILIARWRMPSLSLHRIENAMPGAGATTSIPAKIVGKFSIRTVPNMTSQNIDRLVRNHVETRFRQLRSKNLMEISCVHQSDWFFEDSDHWNYQAAMKATEVIWGIKPDIVCEGGSIPVSLDFKEVLKKNVLLLPMGRPSDGAHSINEKLDKVNYINGIKLYGNYLAQVSRLRAAESDKVT